MIRVNLDLEVEEGNEAELINFLREGKFSKRVADFLANTVVPNAKDLKGGPYKIKPLGGNAHQHEANPLYNCSTCVELSLKQVSKKYPVGV